jgi:Fic-DOC domain mobile mystery protein B
MMQMPNGATPLSADDLKCLIPPLKTRGELDEWEQANILDAIKWAPRSRILKRDLLSASGLFLLHERMFNKTWVWAGKLRVREVQPVGSHPKNIQNDLGALIGDVKYWQENNLYSSHEIAIRFSHRLVLIHPFPNGNGRFSRLAADLYLHYRKEEPFTWSLERIRIDGVERERYLQALKIADREQDYGPLLKFAQA